MRELLPVGTMYEVTGQQFDDSGDTINDSISDDELTQLALAADPDIDLDDAVPFRPLDQEAGSLLPEWYMPAAIGRARRDWRSRVSISIAVGLVLINACGICVTNGWAELPFLH